MRLVKASMMLAVATLLPSVASAQTPVLFELNSEAATVLNGIGTSFTVDGITLSADAEGPEFEDGQPTGETIALNTLVSAVLNFGATARFVIDNQSVSDSEFDDLNGDNNEDAFISPDETLTISFDTTVQVTSIDFFSIESGEVVTVAVDGLDSVQLSDVVGDSPDDAFENPLGTLVIPAGTDITFNIAGDGARFGLSNIEVVEATSTPVLRGDANCDTVVNFDDIAAFIGFLSGSDFKAEADVDGSGEIDFGDIAPFIAILSAT